ncbi:MAG: alpha/beta hydrolase [Ruminococcus sp.]|nr:alpha/beta hydrolase [Ruminococcus sp.]
MMFEVNEFRAMCTKADTERDLGLSPPEDIEYFDDISYGPHGEWNLLDVYRPKNAAGKLPVIVSFHGGAWVYGTKLTYRWYCMFLAQHGFAVVNPSYRLAPENRFPAQFEDINRVFGFVLENAEKYGFDTDNIFGVGDSAGGMGLAVYANLVSNPEYASRFPVKPPEGMKLRAVGLNCGFFSTETDDQLNEVLLPADRLAEDRPLLFIKSNITESYPPCFMLTSTGDFLTAEPGYLATAFEEKGVRYESRIYGDEQDRPPHVFHCDIKSGIGRQANEDELAFFRSCMV